MNLDTICEDSMDHIIHVVASVCAMDLSIVSGGSTDPSYSRTTDPDMALSGTTDPDITMASCGISGCSYH